MNNAAALKALVDTHGGMSVVLVAMSMAGKLKAAKDGISLGKAMDLVMTGLLMNLEAHGERFAVMGEEAATLAAELPEARK